MDLQQIAYSTSGQIAHITLNNPQRFNAMGAPMAAELLQALQNAADDPNVRVVLLSGAGKAFCAGGDIDSFEADLAAGGQEMLALVRDLGRIAVLIRQMPKPVIASVQRAAAGAGMGLALLADYCIASDDTNFTTAFAKLGLGSDTGRGYVLARTLGHSRATDLLMGSRALPASEAKQLGLITEVVAAEELTEATVAFIGGLLTGPQQAFAGIKKQIWAAQFTDFEQYLALEAEVQAELAGTADFAEGLAAFRERRPVSFAAN